MKGRNTMTAHAYAPTGSVLDRDECPDRGVGPDLRGGVEREFDAAEALRRAERGSGERVQRRAAMEVADPADSGVVVVRAVGVDAAAETFRVREDDCPGDRTLAQPTVVRAGV